MTRVKDLPYGWRLALALAAYCGVITAVGTWLLPETALESWLRELLHLAAIMLVILVGTQKALSLPAGVALTLVGLVATGMRTAAPRPLLEVIPFSFFDTALVTGCIGGGQLVSRLIRAPNVLVPVGVMAGLVDPLGVYLGFSGQAIHFRPEALTAVSSAIPTTALPEVPFITLGPGDILFAALFLVCLRKFRLNVKAAALWLFVGIAVVFALLLLTPIGERAAIPGLPVITGACLLPSLGAFRFSREEKRSLLVAAIVLLPVVAVLILLSRHISLLLGWR